MQSRSIFPAEALSARSRSSSRPLDAVMTSSEEANRSAGRVSSMAAIEADFGGLVLFSYPLHRPGFPDQLRTEHFPQIRCPTLFMSGDRDPFARIDLLRENVKLVPTLDSRSSRAGPRPARGARSSPRRRRGLHKSRSSDREPAHGEGERPSLPHMVDGPPQGDMFILLHGFPEGAESWLRQVDAIARQDTSRSRPTFVATDSPTRRQKRRATRSAISSTTWPGSSKCLGASRPTSRATTGARSSRGSSPRHPEMTKTLTVLSVGHPAAIAAASRDDEDQKARSSYIRLFLKEGKAEQVLSEDDTAGCGRCSPSGPIRRLCRSP